MSGTDIPVIILIADRPSEKPNGRRRSEEHGYQHNGGGCFVGGGTYPCDDEYEGPTGDRWTVISTMEAHARMPSTIGHPTDLEGSPGVESVVELEEYEDDAKENNAQHAMALAPWKLVSSATETMRRFLNRSGLVRVPDGYLVWTRIPADRGVRLYDRYGREYVTLDLDELARGNVRGDWIPLQGTIRLADRSGALQSVALEGIWER